MSAASIEGGDIVIRVRVADLAHDAQLAFDQAYGFGRHALAVIDTGAFARALIGELNRRERGLTLVERMLDRACVEAVEAGDADLADMGVGEGEMEAAE